MVVIFVMGNLVVFEVNVELWFICGFILIMIIFKVLGWIVNCILFLFVFMLIFFKIVKFVLRMCWYFLLVKVRFGVMVMLLLV